ncbi:MAG: hypothetical protein A3G41_01810 [Elusimicrobia bacterium RIFCSPLOWO2_12_FULL_59_9]|nr:MAG: hypothetical protein A3G41_01810 [Elusimicrobia bacterium RIFCSPLOWO2_12_FULL_59_9]
MQSGDRQPNFYSNLAALYYDQAVRCAKNKCSFACIAMCWAAIDYAIDHELRGGSKLNLETLQPRPQIPHNSHDIPGKLKRLWLLFPELKGWEDELLVLYQCFRNTFLHGKLENMKEHTLDGTGNAIRTISVESGGKAFPLGHTIELFSAIAEADRTSSADRMSKEVHLIGAAEKVAGQAVITMERFFKEFMAAISRADVPKSKESVEQLVFDEWNGWLSSIYTDIQQALVNRHIFRETLAVVQANPRIQTDDTFYSWMRTVYSQAAVVAVRRQADRRKDVVSLARLLDEIRKSPAVISRDRFVALYTAGRLPAHLGHRDFDKFAGADEPSISAAMIEKDLAQLQKTAASIKLFSHKRVAHYDDKKFQKVPTWNELDECLDLSEALLKKYLCIFRAEAHINIVPTWQYDWKEIFLVPWIEKNG